MIRPKRVHLIQFSELYTKKNHLLHVIDCRVFEDLAVVDVPNGLVVPHFAGQEDGTQEDGTQGNAFPASRGNVNLGVF